MAGWFAWLGTPQPFAFRGGTALESAPEGTRETMGTLRAPLRVIVSRRAAISSGEKRFDASCGVSGLSPQNSTAPGAQWMRQLWEVSIESAALSAKPPTSDVTQK